MTRDPAYPGGGPARYAGETVAIQRVTFYQGQIEIVVDWDPTVADSDVTATISGLVNVDGVSLISTGGDAPNDTGADVGQIVLYGPDSVVTTDNKLSAAFDETGDQHRKGGV